MAHASHAEEATKIAKETKFAALGRAIADAAHRSEATRHLIAEAETLRRIEQNSADRQMQFAALTRQVGDAAASGRDTAPLLARLTALRRLELR